AGRATAFFYNLSSRPLLVTRITDPFNRSALLDYDSNGRLIRITDVLGLTSQFTYDSSGLINAMTTPYGATRFAYGQTGTTRFAEATDPLGYTERIEFRHTAPGIAAGDVAKDVPKGIPALANNFLEYRNTFYWDKHTDQTVGAGD